MSDIKDFPEEQAATHAAFDAFGGFDRVYRTIGQVTATFAQMEAALSSCLKQLVFECANPNRDADPVAHAVLGGMRWDDMWDMLKRVMIAKNYSVADLTEVDEIRKYTGSVKKFRDLMAHNHFSISVEDSGKVSVRTFIPRQRKPGHILYELGEDDLTAIEANASYAAVWLLSLMGLFRGEGRLAVDSAVRQSFAKMPPLPSLPETNTQPKSRKPKRQPRSSPE